MSRDSIVYLRHLSNDPEQANIIDTPGLFDPQEKQRDEAIINFKKYLFENKHQLSTIILYILNTVRT